MTDESEQVYLLSLQEFAHRHQIGLTTVYTEIKAGRLVARKIGRRTLIDHKDAAAWREQLPRAGDLSP